jgi:hypothetical protein
VLADEQGSILSIWREAFAIIRRYPFATFFPAAVLGTLGDAPYFFIKEGLGLPEEVLTTLTGLFAYYLYIVYTTYAEEITVESERGVEKITIFGVVDELRQASHLVPSVLVASVGAILLPLVATTLLVIAGRCLRR